MNLDKRLTEAAKKVARLEAERDVWQQAAKDFEEGVDSLEAAIRAKDAALRAIKDRDWLKLIDIAGLANHEELGLLSAYELEGDFAADARHHFPARMQLFKAVARAAPSPDAGKGKGCPPLGEQVQQDFDRWQDEHMAAGPGKIPACLGPGCPGCKLAKEKLAVALDALKGVE